LNWGAGFSVTGEGEITLHQLICQIREKKDISQVKGISYRDDQGKIVSTRKNDRINLNDWNPLSVSYNKLGPLELTRGCIYRCKFCQTPGIFGNKVRHRSPDNIFRAVEWMKRKNYNDVRFITPNAFGYYSLLPGKANVEKLVCLLDGIKRINKSSRIFFGTFPSEIRPDYVTCESLHVIKKYATNRNIVIGAQTGSNRMLARIRRGHTAEDIYKAVYLTASAGLKPYVDIILGLPDEEADDVIDSMKCHYGCQNTSAYFHATGSNKL
jgi:B12-binding domain/radical SAM domain protein